MPGILAWLIEGCLEWQAEGLRPPSAVLDATAAYLEAEDAIGAWIEDPALREATEARVRAGFRPLRWPETARLMLAAANMPGV